MALATSTIYHSRLLLRRVAEMLVRGQAMGWQLLPQEKTLAWLRHGIHAFLELLRYPLQDSLEHMLMFIYLAYSMMALVYETVPTFEDNGQSVLGI